MGMEGGVGEIKATPLALICSLAHMLRNYCYLCTGVMVIAQQQVSFVL